jgi:hypothetical protein
MQPYQNLNGNSGVASYESGPNAITVQFRDGGTYVYDDTQPGADHVQRMKELAETGRGLSAYISKYVRDRYARKVR